MRSVESAARRLRPEQVYWRDGYVDLMSSLMKSEEQGRRPELLAVIYYRFLYFLFFHMCMLLLLTDVDTLL